MTQQFHFYTSIYPREETSMCPYKDLYADGHKSFIYKNPKPESIQCPPAGWVNQLSQIYATDLHSATKEDSLYVQQISQNIMLSETRHTTQYAPNDCICMKS